MRDLETFYDKAYNPSKSDKYVKLWWLYKLIYAISSLLFFSMAIVSAFGIVYFDSERVPIQMITSLVSIGLIVGLVLLLIEFALYTRGKGLQFDTIDALSHEFALAVGHFHESRYHELLQQLERFHYLSQDYPPLYPVSPVPSPRPTFYSNVLEEIENYIQNVSSNDDRDDLLEETFQEFATEIIILLEKSSAEGIMEINSEIDHKPKESYSSIKIIVESLRDIGITPYMLRNLFQLSLVAILGVLVYVFIDEMFATLITAILLALVQVNSTR